MPARTGIQGKEETQYTGTASTECTGTQYQGSEAARPGSNINSLSDSNSD
jgi:hypothetical protein